MFGFKSFLNLGELTDSSISGLYQNSYELDTCNYTIGQGTNSNGQAQGEVHGGTFQITYGNVPPDDILQWMIKPGNKQSGVIVICDTNDVPLEKIFFEDGVCVNMQIQYNQYGSDYTKTSLIIRARTITVGSVSIENRWKSL